jgi:hypothetical protein
MFRPGRHDRLQHSTYRIHGFVGVVPRSPADKPSRGRFVQVPLRRHWVHRRLCCMLSGGQLLVAERPYRWRVRPGWVAWLCAWCDAQWRPLDWDDGTVPVHAIGAMTAARGAQSRCRHAGVPLVTPRRCCTTERQHLSIRATDPRCSICSDAYVRQHLCVMDITD